MHRETLGGRQRDGQGIFGADRLELAGGAVEAHHHTLVNVDKPSVQRDFPARDPGGNRRMGTQVRELDDDIFEAGGADKPGGGFSLFGGGRPGEKPSPFVIKRLNDRLDSYAYAFDQAVIGKEAVDAAIDVLPPKADHKAAGTPLYISLSLYRCVCIYIYIYR